MKVCGLTTAVDANAALAAGADALGFVFHPGSPRKLAAAAWPPLRAALAPYAYCVAVFGGAAPDLAEAVLSLGGFSACQVHGSSPELPRVPPGLVLYRAFDPARDDLEEAVDFRARSANHRVLLDPRRQGQDGGTGTGHNDAALSPWLARFPDAVLAGGLGPDNVAAAVARHRPAAVDASSALELSPGQKDHALVQAYITRAKGAA